MSLYEYHKIRPVIGKNCFIAEGAVVSGHVILGDDVNIWFNSVLRGDMDKITIGEGTNVQDLCMLHVDRNVPLTIGKGVTIGHRAVLHGCTIGDHCLIGMGAIVLDKTVIGEGSVVAAGAVVAPGKVYPPYSLIMGVPAQFKRELTEEERATYSNHYKHYVWEKNEYLNQDTVVKI